MRSRRSTWRCGTSRARRSASRCGGCSAARASRVPVYATFGFGFFDREQLAAAAKLWVAQGFRRLKMTVGNEALRQRDQRPLHE